MTNYGVRSGAAKAVGMGYSKSLRAQNKMRIKSADQAIYVGLVFSVFGPIIGGLLAGLASIIHSVVLDIDYSPVLNPVQESGMMLVMGLLMALPIGGVGALATGLYFGLLRGFQKRFSFVEAALVGFNTEGYFFVVSGLGHHPFINSFGDFLLVCGIAAVAAVICLWLCRRFGLVANSRAITS